MYAFDRATGKRLWFFGNGPRDDGGLLDSQTLILEQFADLPVIIAAGPMSRNGRVTYPVVVIEKERGKLLLNREIPFGNHFHNMVVNMKNGTVDLNRFDLRIYISPEEPEKAE